MRIQLFMEARRFHWTVLEQAIYSPGCLCVCLAVRSSHVLFICLGLLPLNVFVSCSKDMTRLMIYVCMLFMFSIYWCPSGSHRHAGSHPVRLGYCTSGARAGAARRGDHTQRHGLVQVTTPVMTSCYDIVLVCIVIII